MILTRRIEIMGMKEITYKDAVREAMVEEMRRDEEIIFLGEDIGV